LLFHHGSPSISTSETAHKLHASIFFTCKHVRHLDTPPYCNTTQPQPLAKTVCKQEHTQFTAMTTHFRGVIRHFLAPNDLKNMILKFDHYTVEHCTTHWLQQVLHLHATNKTPMPLTISTSNIEV
jgi:hypothetical protein